MSEFMGGTDIGAGYLARNPSSVGKVRDNVEVSVLQLTSECLWL